MTSATPTPVPAASASDLDRSRRPMFAVLGLAALALLVVSAVLSIQAVPAARLSEDATIPAAFLGLATQPVVITVAVAGFAGTRLPRWFVHATTVGTSIALGVVVVLLVLSFADGGASVGWGLLATVAAAVAVVAAVRLSLLAHRER